jgi:hypothetical protein
LWAIDGKEGFFDGGVKDIWRGGLLKNRSFSLAKECVERFGREGACSLSQGVKVAVSPWASPRKPPVPVDDDD